VPGCGRAAEAEPFRSVGDPVDVVTGAVSDHTRDFRLIGPLFLDWFRTYDSACNAALCSLGWGHGHSYSWPLVLDADGLSAFDPVGRRTGFPPLLNDWDRAAEWSQSGTCRHPDLPAAGRTRSGPRVRVSGVRCCRAGLHQVFSADARVLFHRGPDGRLERITHSTGLIIAAEEDAMSRLLSLTAAWGGAAQRPLLTGRPEGGGCGADASGHR
jgi:hypothetical protein